MYMNVKYDIKKSALTSQESLDKLTLALDDPIPNIRTRAAYYISKIGTAAQKVVPRMIQIAENDPDEDVRCSALIAIGLIHRDKHEAIQYLRDYSENSKSQRLKEQAEKSLITATRFSPSYGVVRIKQNPAKDLATIHIEPKFLYDTGHRKVRPVAGYGVLPLHINIKNLSSTQLSINPENITLLSPGTKNTPLKRLSWKEAVIKMQYSMKRSVAKAIMFGPLGIASPFRAGRANKRIANNTEKVVFREMEIVPLSQRSGYLFFELPRNTRNIVGYKILFNLSDQGNNIFYKVAYTFGDKYQVSNTIGKLPVNSKDDTGESAIEMKLASLKNLLDKGIISDEEYTKKRASIINAY